MNMTASNKCGGIAAAAMQAKSANAGGMVGGVLPPAGPRMGSAAGNLTVAVDELEKVLLASHSKLDDLIGQHRGLGAGETPQDPRERGTSSLDVIEAQTHRLHRLVNIGARILMDRLHEL